MNTDFVSEVVMADAFLNQMSGKWNHFNPVVPDGFFDFCRESVQYEGFYKNVKKSRTSTITCTYCHHTYPTLQAIDMQYVTVDGKLDHGMATCPHCQHRILITKAHPSKVLWQKGDCYAALHATINGIECYRIFHNYIWRDLRKEDTSRYNGERWHECLRLWHGPEGERVSTLGYRIGYYEARYNIESYLTKLDESDYRVFALASQTDQIGKYKVYPEMQVIDNRQDPHLPIIKACLSQLKTRAILHRVIHRCFDTPMIETLVKSGQLRAAAFLSNVSFERGAFAETEFVNDWVPGNRYLTQIRVSHIPYKSVVDAFKVANRHGYSFDDPVMYTEYLDELFRLGLDLHSPKYLCPDNLREAHSITGHRLDKKVEARVRRVNQYHQDRAAIDEAYRARWQAEQLERDKEIASLYPIEKRPFLGIRFESKNLSFHVLQSVDEFKEEANAMDHCVFRCGYYKKKQSVILSARLLSDNTRISTIELGFSGAGEVHILQNRGVSNEVPPYYKESQQTLQRHFPEFSAAYKIFLQEEQERIDALAATKSKKSAASKSQQVAVAV